MASCGTCRNNTPVSSMPEPLFQIRHGYRARWGNLAFSVESDSGNWTLRIQDPSKNQTLYTAHRGQARAAQLAAAEFAIFLVLGAQSTFSPDRLARDLSWQEYW